MNKTIYIRNLFVFVIFVAVIFATPFVFADVSAPNLIRLTNTNAQLHNYSNIGQVNGSLGSNSIIQLPDEVAEEAVFNNGQMDLHATLQNWVSLARQDRTLPPKMGPNGRLLFPVKIIRDPFSVVDTNSEDAYGYMDLIALSQNANSYSSVRMNVPEDPNSDPVDEDSPIEPIIVDESSGNQFYDEEVYGSSYEVDEQEVILDGGGSEVTGGNQQVDIAAPDSTIRPQMRPFAARPEDLEGRASFRCSNSWDGSGYQNSNCLSQTYDDFKDHVQHVLSDLEAINQLRAPRVPVDPRFSICIGYKESHLSPNAVHRDSGGGAWGMFQVRNSTGREAIAAYGSVVSGFEQYDSAGEYTAFRSAMLRSTLAQADLHHSVILKKAEYAGLLQRMGNGSMTFNHYHTLAERYYGGAGRTTYANKVISCMRGMAELVSEYGQIAPGVTGSQLRTILQRTR